MSIVKLINPKNTALIVVDIQNDYCADDGKVALERKFDLTPVQKSIPVLIRFLDVAREYNVPIIFTRMIEDHRYMKTNAKIKFQTSKKGLDLCTPNTYGFEYYQVKPQKGDFEITKKTYDAFSNATLEKILKRKKIKNIILVGAYTAVCVDATLRSAFTKGYNIVVPRDLVSMPKERQRHHRAAIDIWNFIFAHVLKSREIETCWKKDV